MKIIVLSSGHMAKPSVNGGLWDKGATNTIVHEGLEVPRFTEALSLWLLEHGYRVMRVADNITLRETLKVVKGFPHDLAIEVHMNASDNPNASGVEVFYNSKDSCGQMLKDIASKFCSRFSKTIGYPNRGAKDSKGSLAWNRVIDKSILVELGFINGSKVDQEMLLDARAPLVFAETMGQVILEVMAYAGHMKT